jgi:presenilin-like A22 family membrane protease
MQEKISFTIKKDDMIEFNFYHIKKQTNKKIFKYTYYFIVAILILYWFLFILSFFIDSINIYNSYNLSQVLGLTILVIFKKYIWKKAM